MHGSFKAIETTGKRRARERPVYPNAGLEAAYRKKLERLVRQMNRSVVYWVKSSYRNNPPDALMAMDDIIPSSALQRALDRLVRRWLKNFDVASSQLAKWYAISIHKRSDAVLTKILRDGGWSVKFQQTEAMKDIVNATIEQNISLIKSIPQQYLKNVQGDVMRSIQAGRDLGGLSKALQKNYGVTKRRAAFIARSQNNLATGAMVKARQIELGLKAKWRHSGAGKHPRPTHVKNNGKLYDPAKGWFDPAVKKHIFPGELPNCRCASITVVPGFG
jgi:uncharacterized protein with gpF-like domain